MGQYTEHWEKYKRASARDTFRLLRLILCVPVIGLVGLGLSQVTDWAVPVLIGLLVAWLCVFTLFCVRASRVLCPQCSKVYSRGKYLCNCPHCGLRMLQEDAS